MVRAILFDKDGTLIDFERTYGPSTARVLLDLSDGDAQLATKLGQSVDFDFASRKFSPSSVIIAGTARDMAEIWAPSLQTDDQEGLVERIDQLYLQHTGDCVWRFDFTRPALGALQKAGYFLGIATNDSAVAAHQHAQKAGIDTFFDMFIGHDSGYGQKPGPGMVEAFAKNYDLPCRAVAMIGDSLHDMKAGKAAGSLCVGVASGMASRETLAPEADYVLDHMGQLPELLASLD